MTAVSPPDSPSSYSSLTIAALSATGVSSRFDSL